MDQFSSSIPENKKSSINSTEHEQINRLLAACTSKDGKKFELRELENRLRYTVEKCRIKDMTQLSERMKRTEERIQQYQDEKRIDAVEYERKYLNELKQLQTLREEIAAKYTTLLSKSIDTLELNELEDQLKYSLEKCKITDVTQLTDRLKRTEKRIEQYEDEERKDAAEQEMSYMRDLEHLQRLIEEILFRKSTTSVSKVEANKRTDLENLRDDFTHMPCCVERTTMELLAYFQQKLLRDCIDENTSDSITLMIEKWKDQIQKEELISEQIRTYLQDFNRTLYNEDWSSVVRELNKILNQIRPLHVQEIQRLITKTKGTAALINGKDIILLVGQTGSGKSTTVQFLTGATMKNIPVEIASGMFLEHITVDGPARNAGLNNVTSSPFSRSETRYIIPVTVQLKDILGAHQTGEIILCDAPGFEDTAGPEVDIANSMGVIEALKNCNSVKILALSSYMSLGDRGEGIIKLVHILINMIDGIKDRLNAILYAFTKYPSTTDIHPVLSDIKKSKVNEDVILRSDTAFVAVLEDMIDKTKGNDAKIDPIDGNPGNLIQKLQRLQGIRYPGEVFRFAISEQTQSTIRKQTQKYKSSIMCAFKNKDIDLVMYYLNNLKVLNDFVQDTYADSIQSLSKDIEQYYTAVMEKFNRYFVSQDGLRDEDIQEYRIAHEYIQQIQTLRIHLGSKLVSVDIFIENILSELGKRNVALRDENLYSPSIGMFLDNLHRLQSSIKELEPYYKKTCEDFSKRFELTLVEPIPILISSNEFKQVADIMSIVSKCVPILNHHIDGKVEENYRSIINSVLQHLNSFSEEAKSVLSKFTLNQNDIEILEKYINLMKSVKNDISVETLKDLNQVYEEFISKIITYFDEIILRIKKLLNGNDILEYIEPLVIQMEMIRTLPDIESKTIGKFYHTIQDIRGYMQKSQRDVEDLLHTLEQQSGVINYRRFARSLLRLKNIQWIDRISPGTCDSLMRHIREELEERADQLEKRLKNFDLNLKSPQNILLAKEIIEKIESMQVLEDSIPELKNYRDRINEYFIQNTKKVFDNIQNTFNLADKNTNCLKQELIKLEQIQNEYDQLYPARNYLRTSKYFDIDVLNHDIENLRIRQKTELEELETEKHRMESQLNDYNIPVRPSGDLPSPRIIDRGIFKRLFSTVATEFQRLQNYPNEHLKQKEKSDKITKQMQEDYDKLLESIEQKREQFSDNLTRLEYIKSKYNSLVAYSNSNSPKETDFLKEKEQTSYELLEKAIREKVTVLADYEQNNQMYYFSDMLDACVANNALIYISNCEKIRQHNVQEITEKTGEALKKYLEEYGDFLEKEIKRNFKHIINLDENDLGHYSTNLEKCFEALSSLDKYTLVFENLHGAKKLADWDRKFFNDHRVLEHKMSVCKTSGRNDELRNHLIIAQALSCIDRFFTVKIADNGFRTLYRQYQIEIARESREGYNRVIEYIGKSDYATVDLALSDIVEDLSSSRFLAQIKHELQCSLNTIIKNTRSYAHYLEKKIKRQEDNREKIREINDNIDKIRLVLNRDRIMKLIDDQTKSILQKFEHEISQILSTAILNGIKNIELFIDSNSFLEAEQCTENLTRVQQELAGYYTSKLVDAKLEDIKTRLSTLPSDILERYDFVNLNNYSVNPPKDILEQLQKVVSGGYARYLQSYNSFMEKIRVNFTQAIERVRNNPLDNPSTKIRSIKHAFLVLPVELKTIFQMQIDELDQLNINENPSLEFD